MTEQEILVVETEFEVVVPGTQANDRTSETYILPWYRRVRRPG